MLNKEFTVLGEQYIQKGDRKRKYLKVQCVNCLVTALMTVDQSRRTNRILHKCNGKIAKKLNWLTIPWVKYRGSNDKQHQNLYSSRRRKSRDNS